MKSSWLGVRFPRLALTVGALFVAGFAVMPWVHIPPPPSCTDCDAINRYGSQLELTTGLGDGRVVALFAIAIVLLRVSLVWLARWQTAVYALAAVLALGATAITARVALRDWGTGEVTGWLYADLALSVAVALCAGLLLGARMRGELPSGEDVEESAEVTQTWA